MAGQEALSDFSSWVFEKRNDDFRGYVASIHDADTRHVTLRWHNLRPEQEKSLRARADAAGISLTLASVPYNPLQVDKAVQQLIADAAKLKANGIDIESISPHPTDGVMPEVTIRIDPAHKIDLSAARDVINDLSGAHDLFQVVESTDSGIVQYGR